MGNESIDSAPRSDGNWRFRGACFGLDPEIFFPVGRGRNAIAIYESGVREAKKICRNCPVTKECLQFAIDSNATDGVWGGLSKEERGK